MKNMNNTTGQTDSFFAKALAYLRIKYAFLIVFVLTFASVLTVSFFDAATGETLFSFPLAEYQVDQIADRTIIAQKTLLPTELNPFTIVKGEEIIKKGFPITQERYDKLKKMAETPAYVDLRAVGNAMLFFMLLSVLMFLLFSSFFLKRQLELKEAVTLAIMFVLVYAVAVFGRKLPVFSTPFTLPIILPASFVVMLTAMLFSERVAVYFSFLLFFAVLYGSSAHTPSALFVLSSAVASARIVRKLDKRISLVFASVLLALLNWVFLFTLEIIYANSLSFSLLNGAAVAFNGFLSGILALGFLTPLEVLLNTASVFRLMDLSDLNNPLMHRMLLAAPGTYNHSMLVATLAENACSTIGANGLLARVGAYYHDIGKLEQPEYFIENQTKGNKHNDINPRLSVSVIRNHVKKGVERAVQMRFPQQVIDIIAQHHGNGLIVYFYNEAKKADPNVSEEEFSYTGTPPASKEAAVVMLADTVEAASRTLENPSVPRLEKFIRQLVMGKYESGQLDKADLTFSDLDKIKNAFVNILAGYYHSRIEYPNQRDPEADAENTREKQSETKNFAGAASANTSASTNGK
ncbi:HDIG domain-containing metalloprotein [Treponema lecithinolyticum]|uniref:HD family phosphohydrolase n=1 Tax=Treponema lecithinolyticum TaxID=53418 RepID=UPI0028E871DD|nr:HDIG domain-containing metalloprotein [Treponema lecithinolyticum]